MGLNGIYPVNFYPYNIQIRKKSPVETVNPDAEQKQQPSENTDLNGQTSSGYKSQIDYSTGSVNISQIISDFKNTLVAIGAPKEINDEVKTYLNLIELQSTKENPSPKIIKSNLANASAILDGYISETLNKPSRVVKDWIDALLLQKVEYKSDKPVEQVQITAASQISQLQNASQVPEIKPEFKSSSVTKPVTEEDLKLKDLYRQAEKVVDSGDFNNALKMYEQLIPVSQQIQNTGIEAKIYMDKAYIHDVNGDYLKALESYYKASTAAFNAGDQQTQAQAHYNMASIYDDFGKTDTALAHYYESLSLDGQTENLNGQTLALNDVGNLFASQKDYKQALDHYKVGFSLTKETSDDKGKACILSNTAGVFRDLGYDDKALKYYKDSIKIDTKIGNVEGYAKSYEQAGDIMLRNNCPEKAESLYQKSLLAAQKIGDSMWTTKMLDKLQQNSLLY